LCNGDNLISYLTYYIKCIIPGWKTAEDGAVSSLFGGVREQEI